VVQGDQRVLCHLERGQGEEISLQGQAQAEGKFLPAIKRLPVHRSVLIGAEILRHWTTSQNSIIGLEVASDQSDLCGVVSSLACQCGQERILRAGSQIRRQLTLLLCDKEV
jgi:hypothetical protein